METFIIAEAGVNHNGDEDLAIELIDIASEAKADAIKFQTFSADKLVQQGAQKAEYQIDGSGEGTQYDMLKKLELTTSQFDRLIQYCETKDIEFMSTAFDIGAADYLVSRGIKRFKIPSGEITNHPFIAHISSYNIPIILSTGMANLDEIIKATNVISSIRTKLNYKQPLKDVLTVLHCTSNYPTSPQNVNLRAMQTIAEALNVPVGYSDHTEGVIVSTAAVALGATVIEKHFTLDKNMKGPDHAASLSPEELRQMIKQIRLIDDVLGSSLKAPTQSEQEMLTIARRGIKAAANLAEGDIISELNIEVLRPGVGITPDFYYEILGKKVLKPISAGSALEWIDLGEN
ncbi:N-acetylneuraminate synthase [Gammaproteobacteria bacterium]|nr:N-acetylneuraminate synthase [Gammaproteobacteria bacterium]MDA9101846.1 N-acetylneuraminate synthase [Gammaproteobacteria bacterium]